ncbi:hypothetical protein Rleg5DRAFT_6962 [Rhizobium leguminosarum bv. viciae WSM1455]|nr:hypothetical protein Rleg5DRAFT_6962 [Rhizobium leguminosarum bv. viciae WSM1455]
MELKKAFDAMEVATKFALLEKFSADDETVQKIDEAFKDGHQAAIEHLKAAFGAEDTDDFLQKLNVRTQAEKLSHR